LYDNKIHVVLAVYDLRGTYSRHAGVALASMFSNTTSAVRVHILHDETLNEDNKNKFIDLTDKFGQEIDFIDVSEHVGKICADLDKLARVFSRGALFRLFIQDVVSVDTVIYLDCDVVVELDIKELWDTGLGDCKVGAVLDEIARNIDACSKRRLFFCRYAGIDVKKYFNSGVVIFNFKKIREADVNISALALEFFRRYPHALFPDQDFLNKVFQKSMYEMDLKFNYFGSGTDYSSTDGKLWHFAGDKPWERVKGLPTDVLYWRYFAMTPWRSDLTADMIEAWAGSRFIGVRSSECYKILWRKFKKSLSTGYIWPLFKIAVIWHDVIYRIKNGWKRNV